MEPPVRTPNPAAFPMPMAATVTWAVFRQGMGREMNRVPSQSYAVAAR